MKKFIYISIVLLAGICFSHRTAHAQSVFNDTILFKILKTRTYDGGFRYLMEFQSVEQSGGGQGLDLSGKGVLSLCACYCDSIWDAWPAPSDSVMTGGAATLTLMSTGDSGGGGGIFNIPSPNRQYGRLNIWQMPGSFIRTKPFTLPFTFKLD